MVSSSLFLSECDAINSFCELIQSQGALPSKDQNSSRYIVVCERKEDLLGVRAQIAHNMMTANSSATVLGGVAMFTLDALCSSLMSAWGNLKNKSTEYFKRPFLDIVTQENILKTILLRLRFPSKECLAVAKQILLLIDTPMPEGMGIFDILLEHETTSKFKKTLTTQSLKQILAAFQMAQKVFDQFSRTQEFVSHHFPILTDQFCEFNNETKDVFRFTPSKFINSHLLWVCAPTYISARQIQPGNFQPHLSRSMQSNFLKMRQHNASTQRTFVAEFNLEKPNSIDLSSIEALVISPERKLWEKAQDLCMAGEFVLLGDFDIRAKGTLYASHVGTQLPIHAEHVESFLLEQGNNKLTEEFFEDLIEASSLIDDTILSPLDFTGPYGLPWLTPFTNKAHLNEILLSASFQESIFESSLSDTLDDGPLGQMPKALSLFATAQKPKRIYVLGRPHSHRAPSFNIKRLNDSLAQLIRNGVDLELPASDLTYAGFYQWLVSQNVKICFLVSSLDDVDKFPGYLSRKAGLQVALDAAIPDWATGPNSDMNGLSQTKDLRIDTSQGRFELLDPVWWQRLNAKQPKLKITTTQFEDFIKCPMYFYMKYVCKLSSSEAHIFEADPLMTGTGVHSAAEHFLLLLKYIKELTSGNGVKQFLNHLAQKLSEPEFVASGSLSHWENEFDKILGLTFAEVNNLVTTLSRNVTEALFLPLATDAKSQDKLQQTLQSQLIRRSFMRLVRTELTRIEDGSFENETAGSLGGLLEKEFTLSIPDLDDGAQILYISGKWDRVDFSLANNEVMAEIIDYKTSSIPKTERKLCLFPSEFENDSKSRLSVQGAVYVYAWLSDKEHPPCKAFTLYRLKSLDLESDPFLKYEVTQTGFKDQFIYEYQTYISSLSNGKFCAKPLNPMVCSQCPALHFCPVPKFGQPEVLN